MADNEVNFTGGAKRSSKRLPYHLITREIVDLTAKRLQIGAVKYGEGNWVKGGREFFLDAYNHLVDHIQRFRDNDPDEDLEGTEEERVVTHLGAAGFNLMVIAWGLKHGVVKVEDFAIGVTKPTSSASSTSTVLPSELDPDWTLVAECECPPCRQIRQIKNLPPGYGQKLTRGEHR